MIAKTERGEGLHWNVS